MEKNTYFEEFTAAVTNWNIARNQREKERDALIEAGDWDAVKAWDQKEEAEHPVPFTQGQFKALRCYNRSIDSGADTFEIDDLPWDYELADFVETLRKAGIATAVVTDESTALMDGIYGLTKLGCRMAGLKEVIRADEHHYCSKNPTIKKGIEFEIN